MANKDDRGTLAIILLAIITVMLLALAIFSDQRLRRLEVEADVRLELIAEAKQQIAETQMATIELMIRDMTIPPERKRRIIDHSRTQLDTSQDFIAILEEIFYQLHQGGGE